jgi:hypothetical protein
MSGKSPKIMTPTIMKEVDKAKMEQLRNKENLSKLANKKTEEMKKTRAQARKNLGLGRVKTRWSESKQKYVSKIKKDGKWEKLPDRKQANKDWKKMAQEIDKLTGHYKRKTVQFSECIQDSECKDPERPKCLQKTNEGGLGSCVSVKEFDKRQPPSKVNTGGRTRKRKRRKKRKTRKRKRKKSRKKRKRRKRRKTRR